MKCRNGFISNSSSTSFVVCLMPSVDIRARFEAQVRTMVQSSVEKNDIDDPFEDAVKIILDLLVNIQQGDDLSTEAIGYGYYNIIIDVLGPYVIAKIDVGSDEGGICNCDTSRIADLARGNR